MIGIIDSGIGGLTVVRAITERLPGYDIIYFGDTARMPYGNKSQETVVGYALEDIDFLLGKGATIVVIASNTVSSVATERAAEKFDLPILEVISPAVELSIKTGRQLRIGIIGTRATIESGIYIKKIKAIDSMAKVYTIPCPLLVPLVEEGWLKKPETARIVKKYLHPLKVRQIDTLILGCTHYPLLKGIIQRKIGKRVHVIDSSDAIAWKLSDFLRSHPEVDGRLSKKGTSRFYVSDRTAQIVNTAKTILKRNVLLEQVNI